MTEKSQSALPVGASVIASMVSIVTLIGRYLDASDITLDCVKGVLIGGSVLMTTLAIRNMRRRSGGC